MRTSYKDSISSPSNRTGSFNKQYEPVIDRLEKYRMLKLKEQSIREELEYVEESKVKLTKLLTFTPRAGGGNIADKWVDAIEKTEILRKELLQTHTEVLEELINIQNMINLLEDQDEQCVLYLRYVNCLQWTEIENSEQIHYTQRQLYNIRNRAIKHLYELGIKEDSDK